MPSRLRLSVVLYSHLGRPDGEKENAAPQEPLFEQLQEDLDTLLRSSPPVFLPRPLALKDGVAEVVKGKCTHTQMHTFLRATQLKK